jgi:hypothetical protein
MGSRPTAGVRIAGFLCLPLVYRDNPNISEFLEGHAGAEQNNFPEGVIRLNFLAAAVSPELQGECP